MEAQADREVGADDEQVDAGVEQVPGMDPGGGGHAQGGENDSGQTGVEACGAPVQQVAGHEAQQGAGGDVGGETLGDGVGEQDKGEEGVDLVDGVNAESGGAKEEVDRKARHGNAVVADAAADADQPALGAVGKKSRTEFECDESHQRGLQGAEQREPCIGPLQGGTPDGHKTDEGIAHDRDDGHDRARR